MYKVEQFLTNALEVNSGNAVVIEILAEFIDQDDQEKYYIVKCRKNGNSGHSWYYEDELDLLSENHLNKYYQLIKE